VKLFRPAASPHQTALAMIGAKPGGTVIVVGASEPALAAEVALVTGLNGHTLVVIPDAADKTSLETAAANAGALIDVEIAPAAALPAGDGAFDVAVLLDAGHAADRIQIAREAARVIRPGGRVVIIAGRKTGGIRKLLGGAAGPTTVDGDAIITSLASAGLKGTRLLGSADGVSYFEGTRSSNQQSAIG
jgi:threonine dehydrogenase-like Zn-dependent dehydrogenase